MSKVVMISVVRNFEMYERLVKDNPFNQKAEFVVFDNNKENIGISARYNHFLENYDYSKDAWFIFCHEDWELKEDISSKLSNLDKDALYGPIGMTIGKFWKLSTIRGKITQSDKDGSDVSKQGYFVHTNEIVGTFDCQCLIVHSSLIKKYNLRFDENLLFDLYVEDFCINAREKYSIWSKILQMECQHYSAGNITDRFYNKLKYLRNKYKSVKAIYCTIANISAVSRPILFSIYVFIRKVCRFFYQKKVTKKGNLIFKICRIPVFIKKDIKSNRLGQKNKTSKKISFFLPQIVMGGVEKVLLEIIKELKKQKPDWRITVYSHKKVQDFYFINFFKKNQILLKDNLSLTTPKNLHLPKLGYKIVKPVYKFIFPKIFKYILSKNDVLIDFQSFSFGKELMGIDVPKIAWIHGSINHFNMYYAEKGKKYINNYDKIVCLSHSFEMDFKEQNPQLKDKIICIYNPINVAEINKKAKIDKSRGKYFCLVSRLDSEKDIGTVINAFKIFSEKYTEAKLIIAGEGPLKLNLQALADHCDGIEFVGKIDEPYTLIKNAIAGILSSYNEGLGMVLLENMALETLSISSKCKSGPPEILMEGKAGLLFEVGNVKELATVMENVWIGKIDTKKLIKTATENLGRFSAEINVKKIINLIDEVSK